jgi:glutathione peroxidase-family protein
MTNVASACGYTRSNYAELVSLHDKYAAQGLEIVAFPCNQFGAQEKGSAAEICKFTADKGVKFMVTEKVRYGRYRSTPVLC